MDLRSALVAVAFLAVVLSTSAQISSGGSAVVGVPPIIQFSDVATDTDGNALSGSVQITFSLYENANGGEPLWTETQNVFLSNSGYYSVYIGITKPNGVPMNLFTTGQAHWVAAKIAGQPGKPRVFLVSAPYAMKAGDAATVGGLPPSAFVLAPATAASSSAAPAAGTLTAEVGRKT